MLSSFTLDAERRLIIKSWQMCGRSRGGHTGYIVMTRDRCRGQRVYRAHGVYGCNVDDSWTFDWAVVSIPGAAGLTVGTQRELFCVETGSIFLTAGRGWFWNDTKYLENIGFSGLLLAITDSAFFNLILRFFYMPHNTDINWIDMKRFCLVNRAPNKVLTCIVIVYQKLPAASQNLLQTSIFYHSIRENLQY